MRGAWLDWAASVTRRWAIAPIGSADGFVGLCVGHHATMGESASSSGVTTARPWFASRP